MTTRRVLALSTRTQEEVRGGHGLGEIGEVLARTDGQVLVGDRRSRRSGRASDSLRTFSRVVQHGVTDLQVEIDLDAEGRRGPPQHFTQALQYAVGVFR